MSTISTTTTAALPTRGLSRIAMPAGRRFVGAADLDARQAAVCPQHGVDTTVRFVDTTVRFVDDAGTQPHPPRGVPR